MRDQCIKIHWLSFLRQLLPWDFDWWLMDGFLFTNVYGLSSCFMELSAVPIQHVLHLSSLRGSSFHHNYILGFGMVFRLVLVICF